MTGPEALKDITDFASLVAYLRDELEWEIPDDLPLDSLTYSYTADELGLKLDAQVEITQLRPILGQENAWGVFFVDFDKAELPVTLLRRILSGVSRRKPEIWSSCPPPSCQRSAPRNAFVTERNRIDIGRVRNHDKDRTGQFRRSAPFRHSMAPADFRSSGTPLRLRA